MMFSTILDVAIGMIFIYLLLSLMCSAANEIIELLLKKRAIDLERGIREMLVPGSDSGKDDIVRNLYNHPLVNNLFGERYEDSKIASKLRYVWRTQLPSYIPARSFSLALMDLVATSARPAVAGAPGAGAPGAGAPGAPPPVAPPPVPPPSSGATGSTPAANFEVNLTTLPPAPLPPGDAHNPLTPLRQAIATSPLLAPVDPLMPDVRQGLIALVDAAGDDVAKARENIENWFNNSMDRVSSWYKRRTQVVILILGLVVAVATNADSITIAKKLSTDKSLRESLVAAAQEYAKANAQTEDSGTQTTTEPAKPEAGSAAPGATSTPASTPTQSPNPVPTPTPCPSPAPSPELPAECKDSNSPACKEKALLISIPACTECKPGKDPKESPQCKLEFNQRQLEALNLPIGWGSVDDVQRKWPSWNFRDPGGWFDQIQWHFIGWLLTALAISLGAPFWFDLLNKFIVIRSAVKPHEKSPEEESKD